jgi:hypothetical protein
MERDQEQAQGGSSGVKAGYQPGSATALDERKAIENAIGRLGYGLVYGTLRDTVLILKTGFSDKYDAAQWAEIAKIVARELMTSDDPLVRSFLREHKVKQVAISAAP